jgi:hypothetical protein
VFLKGFSERSKNSKVFIYVKVLTGFPERVEVHSLTYDKYLSSSVPHGLGRLNSLARKTNRYYQNLIRESGYFFDIEKGGDIDWNRLSFLLRRIFEPYDPNCNYTEMGKLLAEISQLYSPRFLARMTNQTVALSILRKLREFMDMEVWRLFPKS